MSCACPLPSSSSHTYLCQPCISETAYVQMSEVTSCILQLHYLWPESTRFCTCWFFGGVFYMWSLCISCPLWGHVHLLYVPPSCQWTTTLWLNINSQHLNSRIPSNTLCGIISDLMQAEDVLKVHLGLCFHVVLTGIDLFKATIHKMYFSTKYTWILLWKREAQGYYSMWGRTGSGLKSNVRKTGNDSGLFEDMQ